MNERNKKLEIGQQTVFFESSESMEELESNSIDLIVTSPPYNRGKEYSSDFGEFYNDKKDENNYLSFLTDVWKECYRVGKIDCVFYLNIGDSAKDQGISEKVALSAEKASWIRIQDIVWVKSFLGKGHYTPSGGNKRFNNIWEHVYLFVKDINEYKLSPKAIGIPYADKSNIGRYSDEDLRDAGNVWFIPYYKTSGAKIKKGHEAPFPIGLPYRCIKSVPKVRSVLDPFGGTCTTLAACLSLNKKGYAYEKYPRIDVIKSRIGEGKNYQEEEDSLIPHLEQSVDILSELLSSGTFHLEKIDSKKSFRELSILNDVLKNLNINNKFQKKVMQRLQEYTCNSTSKKENKRSYVQKTF
ncbi:MAG: hypothetical protein GF383_11465 [Candidatus Lokiarchaeota archaeon]|nr:hypothetical protein [Candidatus Lokiarchaeota archaeon]MBD3341342.1 hypothetical protein [Candidatus Lokiarchaeota archaeon]